MAGIVVGLPLAIGVTIVLKGSFFGVQIADPIAIGTVAVVLAGVLVAAAYLPTKRALCVDPARGPAYQPLASSRRNRL